MGKSIFDLPDAEDSPETAGEFLDDVSLLCQKCDQLVVGGYFIDGKIKYSCSNGHKSEVKF